MFRQLDDEWVLFDPTADRLHALNLTAALVWSHCTGELDAEAIADAVGGAFDPPVAGADILADVRATLDRFRAEGLFA
ncbi:MAG: PqqD family protein [Gemmatimonadota bacterium]|nr:MAG: PqqD family protein [Gemmatimonadota bacterium]